MGDLADETRLTSLGTATFSSERQLASSCAGFQPSQTMLQGRQCMSATPASMGMRPLVPSGHGGSPQWQCQESFDHGAPASGLQSNAEMADNIISLMSLDLHDWNRCKPCLFHHAGHCSKGNNCNFCHRT